MGAKQSSSFALTVQTSFKTRYTALRGSRYEMLSATHRPDISRRKSPMANLCVYASATMERALTQAWLNTADVPGTGVCQESTSAPNRSAELTVWSELGAGTEVELSIPGSIAYEASPTRPRFRLFRKRTEQDHEHRS